MTLHVTEEFSPTCDDDDSDNGCAVVHEQTHTGAQGQQWAREQQRQQRLNRGSVHRRFVSANFDYCGSRLVNPAITGSY